MKKCLSMILAVIVLFTMLPIPASAADDTLSDRDQLIDLACEVFPEYSTKICAEPISASSNQTRARQTPQLVRTEARKISETEGISYSEYSDGAVFLTAYTLYPFYSTNDVTSDNASTTVFSINVSVTSNYNGDFFARLRYVKYAIVNGDYDYFISPGTVDSFSGCLERPTPFYIREREAANTPAEIGCFYIIGSEDGTDSRTLILNMYLFNGEFYTNPPLG